MAVAIAPLNIRALEEYIGAVVAQLVAPLGVRVLRYPGPVPEYESAGRVSEIGVGFKSVKSRGPQIDEENPLKSAQASVGRSYEIEFNLYVELFDLTDYDDALEIISTLLRLDGFSPNLPNAYPLLLNGPDFSNFSNGYWSYEGTVTLQITGQLPITRPDGSLQQFQPERVDVGIYAAPIKPGPPDELDSVLDQMLTVLRIDD